MPAYSAKSEAVYNELHPKLREIFAVAESAWDHTLLDGLRTIDEQRKNIAKGVSKTMASKHLADSEGYARAVDAMPYPVDWVAVEQGLLAIKRHVPPSNAMAVLEAYMFSGFIAGIAAAKGIPIRQGTDWDGDRQFEEHSFIDIPHTELL